MSSNRLALQSRLALCFVCLAAFASPESSSAAILGLSPVGAQRFGNEDLLIFVPEEGDRFGWSLATGDFNGDGADDLASGMPYDDGFGLTESGLVVVRYGIPGSGLETGVAENALSQFFGGSPDPDEAWDHFGWALAACDFNADGFDDLAVGVPWEDQLGEDGGAVQIHYGTGSGLDGVGDDLFTQASAGVADDPETADAFGHALACGDFNADGFSDLAIGVPGESTWSPPPEVAGAGMVHVIPGSAMGLNTLASTAFDQDAAAMDDSRESADYFGITLAAGDFNGDGYADLAIGVTGEDLGYGRHGAVHVVDGGSSGLTAAGDFLFSESLLDGTPVVEDEFGRALAAGDFDGDGYDDLAVGIPFKDRPVGGVVQPDAGALGEVFGSAAGLTAVRSLIWYETGLPGLHSSEPNDRFGYAVAAGDFDRDGVDDLAIGHPGEDVFGDYNGAATVLMGAAGTGLLAIRNRTFETGLEGVPGSQWEWFQDFGTSLAAGDFDGDGHSDLAIGAPWDDEYGFYDIGTVTVLRGSLFADGFESVNSQYWSSSVP